MGSHTLISAQQLAFAEEYLRNGGNGTQAAITAGYSPKTAGVQAHSLLKNEKVRAIIDDFMSKATERTQVTVDDVLRGFARVAFFDPRKLFDGTTLKQPWEWDDDTALAIQTVEISTHPKTGAAVTKVKVSDRMAALAQLGKHNGVIVDRVEHTAKDGEPLTLNVVISRKDSDL